MNQLNELLGQVVQQYGENGEFFRWLGVREDEYVADVFKGHYYKFMAKQSEFDAERHDRHADDMLEKYNWPMCANKFSELNSETRSAFIHCGNELGEWNPAMGKAVDLLRMSQAGGSIHFGQWFDENGVDAAERFVALMEYLDM